jgi:hypothetical protein
MSILATVLLILGVVVLEIVGLVILTLIVCGILGGIASLVEKF